MYVWVKPRPHTHTKCGLRFPPQYHIYCTWGYYSAPLHINVFSRFYLIIKPTRCTNFSNLFLEWNSTCFGQFLCPSSGVFHCTHSNGICHAGLLTACEQDQDGTPSWSCSQAVSKRVWHIPLLCLQWKTPDDGQRNCPKHAEFYSKNRFEKLVHLVGFIISADCRSVNSIMPLFQGQQTEADDVLSASQSAILCPPPQQVNRQAVWLAALHSLVVPLCPVIALCVCSAQAWSSRTFPANYV